MREKAKRRRVPLYVLYTTSLISATGDAMAAIAIPWFVLQTTGSATQTGIAAFFSLAPIVIGMVFGGTLVDRTGYKRASVVADLASGVTMLLIPVLYSTVGLAFWQLLALVFLGNLLDAPGRSARSAMLPELAKAADVTLDRATSMNELVARATQMLGPPLAGILIGLLGPLAVLGLNAGTFLVSALGVLFFIPQQLITIEKTDEAATSYWQDLRAGFQFIRADTLFVMLIVVVMITNMIDAAVAGVVLPVYVEAVYNDALSLGLIVGVFGVGAVVGTLLYSWRGARFSRRRLFTFGFIFVGVRFLFYLLLPPLWAMLLYMFIVGLAVGPLNPIVTTIGYERIPGEMRARVFGLFAAGVLVAMPLGALLAGYLLEWIGMSWTLVLCTVAYVLATTSLLINPNAAELDARPQPAPSTDPAVESVAPTA